jgi:hypothetical protein
LLERVDKLDIREDNQDSIGEHTWCALVLQEEGVVALGASELVLQEEVLDRYDGLSARDVHIELTDPHLSQSAAPKDEGHVLVVVSEIHWRWHGSSWITAVSIA